MIWALVETLGACGLAMLVRDRDAASSLKHVRIKLSKERVLLVIILINCRLKLNKILVIFTHFKRVDEDLTL